MRLSGPYARALGILVVGGALALAGHFIGPAATEATPVPLGHSRVGVTSESFANSVRLPAYLGSLSSRGYQVEVYLGRTGPLYTVFDLSGRVLAMELNAEALYARFPELDVKTLHAEGDPREPADH
jgi:hypothetical protein